MWYCFFKFPKSEEKTHGKNGKTVKCAEVQDNESTFSFQNCDSRQGRKLWFNGDFFVQNLDASVELPQYLLLSQRKFFSFLERLILFLSFLSLLLFFFFNQRLSSAFGFSMSKGFSLNKSFYEWILYRARCKQNMEVRWKSSLNSSGCRESSPQRMRPGPRFWQLPYSLTFIWKYVFLDKRKIDFSACEVGR